MRGTDNSNQNPSTLIGLKYGFGGCLNTYQILSNISPKNQNSGRRTYSSHVIALDKNQLVTMMVVYFSIYTVIQAQEVSPTAESPSTSTAGMCRTIQFHAI